MTLRNEIMDAVAVYKSLAPTSHDKYYDYLLAKSKKDQQKQDEVDKIGKDAYEAAKKRGWGTPAVPQVAPPVMPTGGALPATAFNPGLPSNPYDATGNYARGGRVKRFQDGGRVDQDRPSEADLILQSVMRPPVPYQRGRPDPNMPQGSRDGADAPDAALKDISIEEHLQRVDAPAKDSPEIYRADPRGGEQGMLGKPWDPPATIAGDRGLNYDDLMRLHKQDPKRYARPKPPLKRAPTPPTRPTAHDEAAGTPLQTRQERTGFAGEEERADERQFDQPPAPALRADAAPFMPDEAAGRPLQTRPEVPPTRPVPHDEAAGTPLQTRPDVPTPYVHDEAGGRPLQTRPVRATPRIADPNAVEPMDFPELGPGAAPPSRLDEPVQPGGEPVQPEERTSALGRAWNRAFGLEMSPEAQRMNVLNEQLNQLLKEKQEITSYTRQTTPREREQIDARVQEIDKQIAAVQTQRGAPATTPSAPGAPGTPGAPGQPTAVQTTAPSSVYGPVPGPRTETGGPPDAASPAGKYPTKVPPPASNGARGGAGGTNSGTGGNSGPGSGAGQAQAPPSAPGAVRTEDPRTRTAAFEPDRERINPDQTTAPRQMNAQGQVVYPTPQEMQQMVATAAQGRVANGGSPTLGEGAVSRQNVQALVAQHNDGGRLTEGQALMAGMHAKFRYLLYQGRAKEAATMAWGLIQAANLEAASLGMVARDQARAGDTNAAKQTVAKALDWAPDGMKHVPTATGMATYDSNNRLTANTPMSPQQVLAMALNLADGSAIWQMLQQAVTSLTPPDKNAEGRQLRNDLTRLQIEKAKRGLQGGGKGGVPGESKQARDLRIYLATGQLPGGSNDGGGGGGGGSSDDTFVDSANAADLRDNDNG